MALSDIFEFFPTGEEQGSAGPYFGSRRNMNLAFHLPKINSNI
jgi:hypothetical protein